MGVAELRVRLQKLLLGVLSTRFDGTQVSLCGAQLVLFGLDLLLCRVSPRCLCPSEPGRVTPAASYVRSMSASSARFVTIVGRSGPIVEQGP